MMQKQNKSDSLRLEGPERKKYTWTTKSNE